MDKIIVATIRDRDDHHVGHLFAMQSDDHLAIAVSEALPAELDPIRAATVTLRLDHTLQCTDDIATADLAQKIDRLSNHSYRLVYDPEGIERAHQLQAAINKTKPHDRSAAELANPSTIP